MILTESMPLDFQVGFTNGAQTAVADAAADKGGSAMGFRPHELLEAAVAACMNMSLSMYAQRHGLPLHGAVVTVTLDRSAPEGATFAYAAELQGPLTEAQKAELLATLETCPVRRTLSRPLAFCLQPGDPRRPGAPR